MRSRRPRGSHALYQRKDGRWEISASLGTIDGARKRRKWSYPTLRAAQHALSRMARSVSLPAAQSPTLAQYLHDTLAGRVALRPRTRRSYARTVDLHITPYLGTTRVALLTPDAVDRWLAVLRQDGVGTRTIQYARSVLRALLRPALKQGLLTQNPAALSDAPKHRRKGIAPLTPAQATALLAALEGSWLDPLVRVALGTGVRPGELLALQWADVDLIAALLTVRQTLQRVYVKGQRHKTRLELAPTKTDASRRTISLPAFALSALREQRDVATMLGSAWVFPAASGGPLEPRNVSRAWYKVRVAAGLPTLRLHDLRHSYATFALLLGVPARTVADALGHAETRTTLDTYGHVLPQQREAVASQMGAFLEALTTQHKTAT